MIHHLQSVFLDGCRHGIEHVVAFHLILNLRILLSVSGISLILVIASLLTLLFDRYNRSLTDIFSRSVLVNEKTLDEIYRAKGYKI
jgi:hypothetical protein